jgi:hypothetical protein
MPKSKATRADVAPTPEVSFGGGAITFRRYPYPGASVHPAGAVAAEDVAELVSNFRPPAFRTHRGEFLVVPTEALDAAREFAERHGIPVVRRVDVWALILEPFMDAAVDRASRRRMREALARCGLSPLRVFLLRWRTSFRVEFVHCVHFRWQHYGLADVLDSMSTLRSPRLVERFYRRATTITALGHVLADDEPDEAERLRTGPRIIPAAAVSNGSSTRP